MFQVDLINLEAPKLAMQMQETLAKDTTINSIANAVTYEDETPNKPMGSSKSSNPYLDKLFESINLNEKDNTSFHFGNGRL